jgi:hypothetical protein
MYFTQLLKYKNVSYDKTLIDGLAEISGSVTKIFRCNIMIKQEKVIPLWSTMSLCFGCPEEPSQGISG